MAKSHCLKQIVTKEGRDEVTMHNSGEVVKLGKCTLPKGHEQYGIPCGSMRLKEEADNGQKDEEEA